MRAFLVLAAVYGCLPAIPFYPFFGLLVYAWLAYMRPHDLAWGLDDTRLSFTVAAAIGVGLLIAWMRGKERLASISPQTILMTLLGLWMGVATLYALVPAPAIREFTLFTKVVLIALITTGLVQNQYRLRWLTGVTAVSLGLLAFKYGLYGLVRGGARFDEGPGGFMYDNNDFAVALNMALPLLLIVASTEEDQWLKNGARVLAGFCVFTIIFTFSRGGLLALGVVAALLLLRAKKPILSAAILALGLTGVLLLTGTDFRESYIQRAGTISAYQEDDSAMGRIVAWKVAIEMSEDYPIYGVGPNNFIFAFPSYSSEKPRVTHNTFLQWLSESGYPAALLWLLLIVVTLWRLERLCRRNPQDWVVSYCRGFQIAIIGYFVGSLFLDKAIFDIFYHVVALSVSLEVAAAKTPMEAEIRHSKSQPWWREPRVAAGQP